MIALNEVLSHAAVLEPRHFRNLTVFPLLGPANPEPDYLLAEEAIAQGKARVTELGGGGSVPELRFENDAELPVLLVDGEELVGAKQNRVLNLTVLAPAKAAIVIPVSCVEAGRWHMDTAEFRPAPHMMYSKVRAARVGHVTASMRAGSGRRSDQSAVWDDIAGKAARMEAASPTQAMSAIYERHAVSVEEYVRALDCQERPAGVVFAIGGRPWGLDLFDHPATMEAFYPKLLRSYALDALDAPERGEPADRAAALKFLARVGGAAATAEAAVGLGKDVRLAGAAVSGAALWANGRYVHVCAFPANGGGGRPGTRMTRPSRRRRG
jgi:hypothetical protein